MAKQAWDERYRLQAFNEQRAATKERIRQVAGNLKVAASQETRLAPFGDGTGPAKSHYRPGCYEPLPFPVRFGRLPAPETSYFIADGMPVVDAILNTAAGGTDTLFYAFGERAQCLASLAMASILEGQARGGLTQSTILYWPDRNGIRQQARSILVDPLALKRMAQTWANMHAAKADWQDPSLAHDAWFLPGMRMESLVSMPSARKVSRPSLLEITPVFRPGQRTPYYRDDPGQVLERVRSVKTIRKLNIGEAAIGSPMRAVHALFTLPAAKERDLVNILGFERFERHGIDAIVVDLTRLARNSLGPNWLQRFEALLASLSRLARRPGIVVVCDDAFVYQKADATMRERAIRTKPPRRTHQRRGLLLRHSSYFGPQQTSIHSPLPKVRYEVDLKDATLPAVRDRFLSKMRELEEAGYADAAKALGKAFNFLRRTAALPVSYDEAVEIVRTMHPGDDIADQTVRARLFTSGALTPLHNASCAPGMHETLVPFVKTVHDYVDGWKAGTPVSMKLATELKRHGNGSVLVSFPSAETVELFLCSNLAIRHACAVVDQRRVVEAAAAANHDVLVLVQPSPETLQRVLLMERSPQRVVIISDAAAGRLWLSGLRPMADLAEFGFAAERVKGMLAVIDKRVLTATEAEVVNERAFSAAERDDDLDFTRDGETDAYRGEVVIIRTSRGTRLLYRPSSDVLRQTVDEVVPFERIRAQDVREGDDILILSPRLVRMIVDKVRETPKVVRALRLYHAQVAEARDRLPGLNRLEKARLILREMRRSDPSLTEDDISNIRRWLDVDADTIAINPDAEPHAPRYPARFRLFLAALGLGEMADFFWNIIQEVRAFRISTGLLAHERAAQFVMDPEGILAHDRQHQFQDLWQAILNAVDTVAMRHRETPNAV